jgi:hypothetical protein
MSRVPVLICREEDGSAPFLDWFEKLPEKAQDKCRVRLERLATLGHELRRPEADFLRDGNYKLRVRLRITNYRILYFFHGRTAAVLSHGVIKEDRVPANEIDRAINRKYQFNGHPTRHTFAED